MSRCAQRNALREFRQEARSRDGAALATAGVRHVGEIALELLAILLDQRHAPGTVVGALTSVRQLVGELRVRRHEPGEMGPQCDDARTGERCDVNDRGGLESAHVGERIGEDQPAFCVGVQHLDGLAGHAAHDVAGFRGAAVGQVLAGGNDADEVERQPQRRRAREGPQHARRATHVELHLVHASGILERDAAAVECDALADERDRGRAAAPAAILEHDELRRFVAAVGDRQERAHAQPLDGTTFAAP